MSFNYFRFYLSESDVYDENELLDVLVWYRSILSFRKDLGFIRASFDLISTHPSISILCESEDDIEIEKGKWRDFLQKNYINLNGTKLRSFS